MENNMRKITVWVALLATLLLFSACRSEALNTPEAETPVDVCVPNEEDCTDEQNEVETPEVPEATAEPTPTEQAEPTPDVEIEAEADNPFEITSTDWVMGSDDPLITIIEYGDFL